MRHHGSCHCGVVTFAVNHDLARASRCNCTVCTKLGVTGALVKPEQFELLSGAQELGTYVFRDPAAQRYFCKTCGTHVFGRGDLEVLGGPFVSINVNCIDDVDVTQIPIGYFDGRHDNWMAGQRATPWPIYSARDRSDRVA